MSACEQSRAKVASAIQSKGEPALVAKFDFSALIAIAMQFLIQYLGNCLNVNPKTAEERVQDSIWYPFFAKKAAKDAVQEKYGKAEGTKDAAKLLGSTIADLDVADRKAVLDEMKQVQEDAGLLI